MEKQRVLEDGAEKTKPWELVEVVDPVQCRVVSMPDSTDPPSKVARLLYTNSGVGLLALGSNAIQKLWKWTRSEQNPSGKATASVVPQHWQPNSGLLMTNDVSDSNPEEAVPCIALSKNDSYVISACGGEVSLFNMMTFKKMTTFMPPPPASTFLAFHPQDNNIIAIGMEDSTIHIYNIMVDEVKTKLRGHQKRITGLAFSSNLNILVSSGADAQLFVWNTDTWEKRRSSTIQLPAGKAPVGDTRVQFHSDQLRLLVFHETQLAIYDASKMERIRQWVPQDVLASPVSHGVYSCNSQLVYAAFCDGNIGVFDADSLRLRCRIAPSAYMSPSVTNSQNVHPLVIAAHPSEPNQLAIGMTDGTVKVLEPTESEGRWGMAVPVDNGVANGRTAASSTNRSAAEMMYASLGAAVASSSVPVSGPSAGARQRSAGATREGTPPEKRSRAENQGSGDRQAPKDKAPPERRPKTSRPVEQGLGPISMPHLAEPAPWRPRLETESGKPLNVEDQVVGNPLVIEALSKACALPHDMERHRKLDTEELLLEVLQEELLNVQRIQVIMDRIHQNASKVLQLEFEKEKLETALEESRKKLSESEVFYANLVSEAETAMAEITRLKAETHELRATAHELRATAVVKTKRATELEAKLEGVLKEKADIQALVQAEINVAFQDGVDAATKVYEKQVEWISFHLFEQGCRAALKEVGVSEDHPIYQNLPKYSSPGLEPSSTPTSEVPLDNAPTPLPSGDTPQIAASESEVADHPEADKEAAAC